ncbi:MAG: NUDIX domain-containing protein [Cocleimonas sp.]|nr:NUDIX domain-containing protein [Cocleimonas sp.]
MSSTYFYNDKNAPVASVLQMGTAVAIRYQNKILLDHRTDGEWGLIGGKLDIGESLEACIRRETREETGLELSSLMLLGLFSHPSRIIERDKVARQIITVCFSATSDYKSKQRIVLSDESKDASFFTEDEIKERSIVATHSMIIPYLFKPNLYPILE